MHGMLAEQRPDICTDLRICCRSRWYFNQDNIPQKDEKKRR